MKRFGFHPEQLHFKLYNSRKMQQWVHPKFGAFQCPKSSPNSSKTQHPRDVRNLVSQYRKRLEWEKYMNPKGLKPTVTSNFPRAPIVHDLVNQSMVIQRSERRYDHHTISFRCSKDLSKLEIKQYLAKLYQLPILKLKTVNKMGKVMKIQSRAGQWRKKDWKKAIVEVDFEIEKFYQTGKF